jgi:predicted RNase H-like nuclease (RuvC/YqgF family)
MNDFDKEQVSTIFAEWRGAVKTALDFVNKDISRLEDVVKEQWDSISKLRAVMDKCRDRCELICKEKVLLKDFEKISNDIENIKTQLGLKSSSADFEKLKDKVGTHDINQSKQSVTLMFYGVIGGALFTGVIFLLNMIFKNIK